MTISEQIIELQIKNPEMKPKQIAEKLGTSVQSVYTARSKMKHQGDSPVSKKRKKSKKVVVQQENDDTELTMDNLVKALHHVADFAEKVMESYRKKAEELFL